MRKIYYETNYGMIKLKLKDVLKKKGYTIYRLAKDTGIKYDTIKEYCNNTYVYYSFETLAKICYALNCDINDLLEYTCPIPISGY